MQMRKNLIILGAGHYGSVVYDIAVSTGLYEKIDFLDDNISTRTIGKLSDCKKLINTYNCAIVAIGSVKVREEWLQQLINCGYEVPVLAHPSAIISSLAKIGFGSIIEPLAVVQANVVVGTGCLVCSGSVLKHNSIVEDCCYIDCNSTVMPGTTVPAKTRVNANSVFFQRD